MKSCKLLMLSMLLGTAISIVTSGCSKEISVSPAQVPAQTVAKTAEHPEQDISGLLTMIDFKVVRNDAGKMVVKGNVKNSSNQKIDHVIAKFNLIDRNGKEVDQTFATVDNLEGQFSWTFEAAIANESTTNAKFSGFAAK